MKSRVYVLFQVLVACSVIQHVHAAEPDSNDSTTSVQEAKAHIQALQEALSEAQNRVTELEDELGHAKNSIEQLEQQKADQAADMVLVKEAKQPGEALTQTVRGSTRPFGHIRHRSSPGCPSTAGGPRLSYGPGRPRQAPRPRTRRAGRSIRTRLRRGR